MAAKGDDEGVVVDDVGFAAREVGIAEVVEEGGVGERVSDVDFVENIR